MTARVLVSSLNANGKKITGLGAGTAGSNDAGRVIDIETARAFAISRTNHSGTQLASTISNFTAAVQAIAINTLAAPTGPLSMNSQRITNVATPTAATDAANKQYVDDSITGLTTGQTFKGNVRALVKTNVNISAPGATLDGLTAAANEVYWLPNQTTPAERGPWVFNGSAAAMSRPANWNTAGKAVVGSYWVVTGGTTPDVYLLMTNDSFVLGTDTPAYKTFDVAAAATPPYETDIGDGAATAFPVAHNLGTKNVHVQVRRNASPYDDVTPFMYYEYVDNNTVSFQPDDVLSASQYHVVIAKM